MRTTCYLGKTTIHGIGFLSIWREGWSNELLINARPRKNIHLLLSMAVLVLSFMGALLGGEAVSILQAFRPSRRELLNQF